MRTLKFALILLLLPFLAGAQAGMTLRTARIIEEQKTAQISLLRGGIAAPEKKVGATLHVSKTLDLQDIIKTGAQVNTVLDDVVTLRATPSQLSKIATIKGVEFIAADNRFYPKLDVALSLIQADSVHMGGGGLPQAYTGKGVIVGVVDFGFNYAHPMFYDTAGNLRIVRVWDMSRNGTAPQGFVYGAEYTTPAQILAANCSMTTKSHGTHVAGIAAGSGGKLNAYKGLAPEANLVLVQPDQATDNELIDAINYIFTYAQSVGKPAVINLSLGYHFGPHDGTSDVDIAIDKMTGKGKIIVGAAGNEGNIKLHASHYFAQADVSVRTIIDVTKNKKASVFAWMEKNHQLRWNIEVWDITTKRRVSTASADFLATSIGNKITNKQFLYNGNRDTVLINASSGNTYSVHRRGVIMVDVRNSNPSKYGVVLVLMPSSKSNIGKQVHLWNVGDSNGNETTFSALATNDIWMTGDTDCTVGEIGGTAKSIISVGAYVSRQEWKDMQGKIYKNTKEKLNHMTTFSSIGPTADGRIKPELVAPGSLIISCVSNCDAKNYSAISEEVVAKEPSGNFYYGVMQGTSMATPMVTGAVALLLQQRPNLTPDSIKCIFMQSSKLDFALSELPKTTRGAGMLNVLAAMKEQPSDACFSVLTSAASNTFWSSKKNQLEFNIVPNPNNGVFYIKAEEQEKFTLNVYNLWGTLVHSQILQNNSEISLQYLPQGVYLVQLSKDGRQGVKKMLVKN